MLSLMTLPVQYLRTLLGTDMQVRPAMERLTKLLNQASLMVNIFTSVKATEGLHILQVLRGTCSSKVLLSRALIPQGRRQPSD